MASILVADDSRSIREMVCFTLRSAGHHAVEAADGEAALRIARDGAFDVVLTDVNMPELDGISLVRELRSLDAFRFTPILVLTTEDGGEKKQAGRAAGATGWLVKPFDPDALLATVRKVLA